jgi:DNA-binding transcriptional LysR family regulator
MGARKLSLRGLRTFCAVARHRSFRMAADEHFVTASAVSHRIKSLEEEVGTRLFERHDRHLALTDTGRALFEEIAPLIERIDETAARLLHKQGRRNLRISAQPFFASELLVPALDRFTADFPDVDITVDTSDEALEKLPQNVDISVRLCRHAPESYDHERLFPLRHTPACSPRFLARYAKDGLPGRSFPVIVHAARPNAWDKWMRESGTRIPEPSNVLKLDSMASVVAAAERGLGAALVPMPLSTRWFDNGSLVRLFGSDLVSRDAYYLVWGGTLDPAAMAFHDWSLQTFAQPG